MNSEVPNTILQRLLQPLTLKRNLGVRRGIPTFYVQMATSGVANPIYQHGLLIGLSMATYIISSEMSVFGASVQRKKL